MKRVRYAVGGVAALVPAAMGMALPAAAHAATTANAIGKGKTVSLNHSGIKEPAVYCIANGEVSERVNSLITRYAVWYQPVSGRLNTYCIGTMSVTRHFIHTNCTTVYFSVSTITSTPLSYHTRVCGNANSNKLVKHTFRSTVASTGYSIHACVRSTYTLGSCYIF